ncbi:MAG: 3-oxoacyl-[acyl-carrier-protein] synthase III C-terminal domain-containing protein [Spirochaetota bacterium]
MAFLHAISTTTPENSIAQDKIKEFAAELFANTPYTRLLPAFDNAKIAKRYALKDFAWYKKSASFAQKNEEFVNLAESLAKESIASVLQKAELDPKDIDIFLVVTSSGFVTPTLDARLIDIIGMKNSVLRLPVTGMGCAGGAYSLSRVIDFCKAYPEKKVLVTVVETCTLTFRSNDKTKANFIALSLFADGASSAIFSGQEVDNSIQLLSYQSQKWPNTLDVMGWEVEDDGLQVIFDRAIPSLIQKDYSKVYHSFLKKEGISPDDLKHFLFHPGGAKVLQAFEEVMQKQEKDFYHAYKVLRDYGNMSSVTIFFVIADFLQTSFSAKQKGLMAAMGPGFSCEQVLFQTT